MKEEDLITRSEAYVDEVFWPGAGRAHTAFLQGIEHQRLRNEIHGCHLTQDDRRWLSLEDNYLIGMCVLYATHCFGPAGMFARTLLHLGTDPHKLLEAVARLSMWIGPIPAAVATNHLQRAVRDYAAHGPEALAAWIPAGPQDAGGDNA